MSWTCPKGFKAATARNNDLELAKMFHVTPESIRNWKNRLGIPLRRSNKVDLVEIDRMLKMDAKPSEIAKATGYSDTTIKRRRRELYGSKYRMDPHAKQNKEEVSAHPRESRESLSMRVKADVMGVDRNTFMAWMKTPKGQEWRKQMNFTGGHDDHNRQSI